MESRSRNPFSRPGFRRGVDLFNGRRFFEAHEAWEELWKESEGQERQILQGLIQVAAGFVKWQRHSPEGSRRLLESGIHKILSAENPIDEIDLGHLVRRVKEWLGSEHEDPERIEFPVIRNKLW